jgi:hypothetical protein
MCSFTACHHVIIYRYFFLPKKNSEIVDLQSALEKFHRENIDLFSPSCIFRTQQSGLQLTDFDEIQFGLTSDKISRTLYYDLSRLRATNSDTCSSEV